MPERELKEVVVRVIYPGNFLECGDCPHAQRVALQATHLSEHEFDRLITDGSVEIEKKLECEDSRPWSSSGTTSRVLGIGVERIRYAGRQSQRIPHDERELFWDCPHFPEQE